MPNFKTLFIILLFCQVSLLSAVKDGVCTRAAGFACVVTCGADEDCDGSKKCCSNGCGSWCVQPLCPVGQDNVNCPSQLCNYAGCPDKPQENLKCLVESCGKCGVKFINKTTGETVDCGPVETLCTRMLAGTKKKPLRLGQFIPSCDADGHFNKVQCHEGSCFCVDERGIPDLSTKTTSSKPECPEMTPCQKRKKEALKRPPLGRFVPQCKSDGSFKEKQCHSSIGQCWCVDKSGREIEGTRTRGYLNCSRSECPAHLKKFDCDPLLCKAVSCPGHKDATCRVNACGKCEAEFHDKYGKKVNCYSKCQQTRMEALGTHTLEEKPEKPVPPGRFVPQCANDGSFDKVQCYGSTGYCWCVDSDGIPVLGTMTRGLPYCNKAMLGVCAGQPLFTCLRNFCAYSSCPAHRDAKCQVNPCGGCKVEFVDETGKPVDCHKGFTKCQLERFKALQLRSSGLQPVGRFVPQCEQDGAYSQIQCWSSTGSCWCVDDKGVEVRGTRVRGKPSCPSGRSARSVSAKREDGFCPVVNDPMQFICPNATCTDDNDCTEVQKCCDVQRCGRICQEPSFTACPNGKPFLLCERECQFAKCPADPSARCFSDPCNKCKVEFRDAQGEVVNCTQGLTPCQARRKMATGLLGEFVPKCKTDGSYEPVQSHEGYSWCVDKDGKEVNGTRKFLEKPSCGIQPMMRVLTLCQLQKLQSGKSRPGRFIPQCKADGSFEEVQCHSSTGYCWCVDTEGWELPGTKIRGTPDCKKVCHPSDCNLYCQYGFAKGPDGCDICECADVPAKPGFCPAAKHLGISGEECGVDNDCGGNKKCCGHVCTDPEYKAKPGFCPAVDSDHVGICITECASDSDCLGDSKCCGNGCGRICRRPVHQACPRGEPFIMCLTNPCEGASCPANPKARCRPSSCGRCLAQFFDSNNKMVNCSASLTKCQKEYAKAISKPHLVGIFIPHCRQDGSFSPMQCHASTGFCWCVTQDGKKVPNNDTRGRPNCGAAALSVGPVCDNGKTWQLCKDVCKNAMCTRNPDARCISPMGGCGVDSCRPKFYDSIGREVECFTECQRKAYEAIHPMRIGAFIPHCNEDGTYARMQCWGSTGYCWCTSADGAEWPGTRVRGQPNCHVSQGPKLMSVNIRLTFNYSFSLVKDFLQAFKQSLKDQLITMFSLKDDQIQNLQVRGDSILVGFSLLPSKDGRDVSEIARDVTNKARKLQLVIHFSGLAMIADADVTLVSPLYVKDSNAVYERQEEEDKSNDKGMSKTSVALIAVFGTLAVEALAFIAYVLIQRKRKNSASNEKASFVYRDGNAEISTAVTDA